MFRFEINLVFLQRIYAQISNKVVEKR